jgi:hypothetical protein
MRLKDIGKDKVPAREDDDPFLWFVQNFRREFPVKDNDDKSRMPKANKRT